MIFSKEKYIEQSKVLVEESNNKLSMLDFEDLYSAALGKKKEDNNVLVEKIVNELFKMPYMPSPLIPWEFIKSPVGEVLSIVVFGMPLKIDEIIFANELADLAGVTVQHISQEIKRGNLDAYQKPNGVWLIREDEANRYLAKKKKPTIKELKAMKEVK
ncbi:MAG: hypothetical protein ACOCG5_04315 [Candidatus Alkaliphilus sp. MAG34]